MPRPPLTPDPVPRDEPVLRLSDVHRSLGRGRSRTPVLRGVDLTARAGAVTVRLGPNGAGKSTTLGLCHGMDRPDAGTVRVFGADPWRASADLRARIGVMWQEGGLPPAIPARRFIGHVASLYRDPLPVEPLLERLLIADVAGRPLRRLSGGQRQRVALAAALVGRPDMLFLDEPTAGLDDIGRETLSGILQWASQEGICVIAVSHDMRFVIENFPRVVVMSEGTIICDDTASSVFANEAVLERSYLRVPPGVEVARRANASPDLITLDTLRAFFNQLFTTTES